MGQSLNFKYSLCGRHLMAKFKRHTYFNQFYWAQPSFSTLILFYYGNFYFCFIQIWIVSILWKQFCLFLNEKLLFGGEFLVNWKFPLRRWLLEEILNFPRLLQLWLKPCYSKDRTQSLLKTDFVAFLSQNFEFLSLALLKNQNSSLLLLQNQI